MHSLDSSRSPCLSSSRRLPVPNNDFLVYQHNKLLVTEIAMLGLGMVGPTPFVHWNLTLSLFTKHTESRRGKMEYFSYCVMTSCLFVKTMVRIKRLVGTKQPV